MSHELKNSSEQPITVKVHGEYYFRDSVTKGRKPFSHTLRVPNMEFFREESRRYEGTDDKGNPKIKINSYLNPRGIIKKKLLPLVLPPKFPDFVKVRSVTIDEIVSSAGVNLELPVTLQSRAQLVHLCKEKKIPISAENYINIDELRTDIIEYQDNPDVFLKTLQQRTEKRIEEKKFLELNDLVPKDDTESNKLQPSGGQPGVVESLDHNTGSMFDK